MNPEPITKPAELSLAFLGTGSMNGAILRGVLAGGASPANILATVRSPERVDALAQETGVRVLSTQADQQANRQAAAGADVVVLGVKPVGIAALAQEIASSLRPGTIVVSIAAAVTTAMIEEQLSPGQPVVRAMPNTPAELGVGVTSISAGSHASAEDMARVQGLLESVGVVVQVPEKDVDAVAAISGSGPAYAFYLAEAMAAAGARLGLQESLARELATKTVAGAGAMLARPDADPTALRRAVTSPNGTTQAAIEVFDQKDLPAIIAEGAQAARERAEEITASLQNPSQAR